MKEGIIELDTPKAREFGFTSDKFKGWLWEKDGCIMISMITSRDEGKGNLSRLFSRILELGYSIQVPTPSNVMRKIVRNKGFKRTFKYDAKMGDTVELWIIEANEK